MRYIADKLLDMINAVSQNSENLIAAIDGRCASGKSTLAELIGDRLDCNIIHMDDFFLRPGQRTEKRLCEPGENIDHERFLEEILIPLRTSSDEKLIYRPFDCQKGELSEPVTLQKKRITIIEGSYSCHKKLFPYYDLRIFLMVDESEQIERIKARNGSEKAKIFVSKWIPMEEAYFKCFDIKNKCDAFFDTTNAKIKE